MALIAGRDTPKQVVGGVEYATEDLGSGGLNIWHLRVPASMRGEGRATWFLETIADEARAKGYEYIVVNMGSRGGASRLLRGLGYEIIEDDGQRLTGEKELAFDFS